MRTVLVVDDQDSVRDVIRIALERAGYRVLEARTPSNAIGLVENETDVDLLLADVVLPEMDAFELASRISIAIPGVEVLYMSGYTDAREEGNFIRKPFSPAEIVAKVGGIIS
jgi:CheY-like chemotaxis protein